MAYAFAIPVICLVLGVIIAIIGISSEKDNEDRKPSYSEPARTVEEALTRSDFAKHNNKALRALGSTELKTIQNAIDDLEFAFEIQHDYLHSYEKSAFYNNIRLLKSHLRTVETKKWEARTNKYLSVFLQYYELITVYDPDDPRRDSDLLPMYKIKCISAWEDYFCTDLDKYRYTVYVKKWFREYLGDKYLPYMENKMLLAYELDKVIYKRCPELRKPRQKPLAPHLIKYITENQPVMRSKLLKENFPGYTAVQVERSYNYLRSHKRIVEYKKGNRYYVSLPTNESEQTDEKSCAVHESING